MLKQLNSTTPEFQQQLKILLAFETSQDNQVDERVAEILNDVKQRGDAAVIEYSQRFDKVNASQINELELSQNELKAAFLRISNEERSALETAAERIKTYHQHQKTNSWQYTDQDGTTLGQKITPLDRVGIYVPGG